MPMRTDCKNYESRTYANGEVVRKCRIDLAPEAPWRCPDECVGLRAAHDRRRLAGRLAVERATSTPKAEPEGDDVAALLDAAEDIVNSAAPDILSEFDKKPRRFGRRKKRK